MVEVMSNAATVNQSYGFQELRVLTRKYSTWALIAAGLLHSSILGVYYGVEKLIEEEEPVYSVRIMKYSDLGPPPSITNSQAAPAVTVQGPVARPTAGTPGPGPGPQ